MPRLQTTADRRRETIHPRRPRTAQAALYMCPLNAIRLNPEFKAEYQAMIRAGTAKVAIVAIMRKLATPSIRDRRKWSPTTP